MDQLLNNLFEQVLEFADLTYLRGGNRCAYATKTLGNFVRTAHFLLDGCSMLDSHS